MKIDLHVHSFFSDGKYDPLFLVKFAQKMGIYLALTDHDTSKGISRVEGMVVPGQEVTTQFGHVVVLCDFLPNPPKEIASLVDYANDNNCISFPSHPFDLFRKGIGNHVYEYKFTALEVFNSKAPRKANELARRAAERLNLPGLANSDSHVKEALGSAYNEIDLQEFNVEAILEKLRKREIKPVPRGLTVTAKLNIAKWYIERKLRLEKDTGGVVREMQGN
ncbi:PHP domain-containing protein [Metallosphaera tengchongensis]|uniref:PHP domain-containing protein n=1 Tax=Metallosphaera tengchongensis TaxID=1532350 RepID=A0A6N0NUA9_9CREN|nr:PHP domain-containing protein [Metallosphaera tengchongensis]QKQ99348.1 PHP domain-containing protein [Metallosphaera tengchongensis]